MNDIRGLDYASEIALLRETVNGSGNIVFFGGAGVSTESGIPDFRSANGLYGSVRNGLYKTKPDSAPTPSLSPEEIISHGYFMKCPKEFFDYYRNNLLYLDAEPNAAHLKLAGLEREGRLRAVITQNIDGLHQKAGSENVIELHGNVDRNFCMKCRRQYDARFVAQSAGIPMCACGGIVKPDVVLYGESLNPGDIERAVEYIGGADVLIIGGTSLAVYPAAGLVRYYKGKKLIIINKSETGSDSDAMLAIKMGIAEVMGRI